MLKEQKSKLSSLMDGDLVQVTFIDSVSQDGMLQQCWHRYHIARDVMQGKLHDSALTFDISEKVAKAIALDELFDQSIEQVESVKPISLFWVKAKDVVTKLSQVGLAACVTLTIIAGVQYQQNSNDNSVSPVLTTVPVGVNVAPVGGVPVELNNNKEPQDVIDVQQYNKIRLLVQDFELQRRLNAQ